MRPLGEGADADKPAEDRPLDSIREMYGALRACWVPPPEDEARHGTEYTVVSPSSATAR